MNSPEQAIQYLESLEQHEAANAVREGAFVSCHSVLGAGKNTTLVYTALEPTQCLDNMQARRHGAISFAEYAIPVGHIGVRSPEGLFDDLPVGLARSQAVLDYYDHLARLSHEIIVAFVPSLQGQSISRKYDGPGTTAWKDGYRIEQKNTFMEESHAA